jgi:hypothetical protein
MVCLEQLDDNGDGSDPAGNNLEPSPKRVRMERQIRLLIEKNEEQATVILKIHEIP